MLLIGLLAVVVGVPASASALAPARVHNLSDPGEHGYGFALDVNEAGDAVAVWLVGDRRIQVATREGHGRWSDPALLTSLPKRSHFKLADVEIDADGDATVVLSSHRGTIEHARGSVKAIVRPAGGTWADPVKVATGGEMYGQLALNDAGDAMVLITNWAGSGSPQMLVATRTPQGVWSAPVEVASGGACWAYWIDESGTATLVHGFSPLVASRHPRGGDWSPRSRSATATTGAARRTWTNRVASPWPGRATTRRRRPPTCA